MHEGTAVKRPRRDGPTLQIRCSQLEYARYAAAAAAAGTPLAEFGRQALENAVVVVEANRGLTQTASHEDEEEKIGAYY